MCWPWPLDLDRPLTLSYEIHVQDFCGDVDPDNVAVSQWFDGCDAVKLWSNGSKERAVKYAHGRQGKKHSVDRVEHLWGARLTSRPHTAHVYRHMVERLL